MIFWKIAEVYAKNILDVINMLFSFSYIIYMNIFEEKLGCIGSFLPLNMGKGYNWHSNSACLLKRNGEGMENILFSKSFVWMINQLQ